MPLWDLRGAVPRAPAESGDALDAADGALEVRGEGNAEGHPNGPQ